MVLPLEARVWFVELESRPLGPFRVEQLRALWQHHQLDADPLLWCTAWPQWRRLSRVPGLVGAMTRPAGRPSPEDLRLFKNRVRTPARLKPAPALALRVGEVDAWPRMWQEEQARVRARAVQPEAPAATPPLAARAPVVRSPPVVAPQAPPPSVRQTLLLICAIFGPLLLGYMASCALLSFQRPEARESSSRPAASPEDPPPPPRPVSPEPLVRALPEPSGESAAPG